MKKAAAIVSMFFLVIATLSAQVILAPSVISSGGGYFEDDNLSISWTLGELAVTTLSGGDLILTQGFQQPFNTGVGITEIEMDWQISVYPNPVIDELYIRFDISDPGDFLIEVQDVTGRLITQKQHDQVKPGDIVLLGTSHYTPGIYFLKVLNGDRQQVQVTTFNKFR
ncbi:MAG: T9SS type A sorting domain-containing protein [Bacteroidota bacterium]